MSTNLIIALSLTLATILDFILSYGKILYAYVYTHKMLKIISQDENLDRIYSLKFTWTGCLYFYIDVTQQYENGDIDSEYMSEYVRILSQSFYTLDIMTTTNSNNKLIKTSDKYLILYKFYPKLRYSKPSVVAFKMLLFVGLLVSTIVAWCLI